MVLFFVIIILLNLLIFFLIFFLKKKKELYGIWEALSSFNYIKNIIFVEGYFDVLLLVQNDIKNVVATLGTSINKDHIDFLFTKTNEIIFCFDGDDAGKKASKKVFDICLCIINEYKKISIVFLEDGYDPDSYIRKFGKIKFLDKLCKAKDLFDYYISFLYDKYNFDHNFDNIVFYNEIKNFFDKLSNKFLKSVYYNRIINLYSDIDFSFLNENDFSKNFFSDKLFNLNNLNFLFVVIIFILICNRNFVNHFMNIDFLLKINISGGMFLYEIINIFLKDKYLNFNEISFCFSENFIFYLKNYDFIKIIDSIPKFFLKNVFFESFGIIVNLFYEKENFSSIILNFDIKKLNMFNVFKILNLKK